jgi:hypothetical protein
VFTVTAGTTYRYAVTDTELPLSSTACAASSRRDGREIWFSLLDLPKS